MLLSFAFMEILLFLILILISSIEIKLDSKVNKVIKQYK